tara:strand:- start:83 stop:349 length:267 start_codon:yes stop_codon:yes gene_type:complete
MKRQLTITTDTAQLSLLRYQNGCLEELLKKTKKTNEHEYLSALNNSVSQLTNLFTKEIDDYEECVISETEVFNRLHKQRESKKLKLLN